MTGSPSSDSQVPPPHPQAVRAALTSLPVPEPGPEFWREVEAALEEESPLQIAPRPAIRPITQPPPTSGSSGPVDDVFDQGGHRRASLGRKGGALLRRHRSRLIVAVVALVIIGLAILGSLDDGESDIATTEDEDAAEVDDLGDDVAEVEESEETTTTEPPPQGPRGLTEEDDARLHPHGLGPLRTGSMTLDDVARRTEVEPRVDDRMFEFSGGRCFEAYLPDAENLTLWIMSPTLDVGVETPGDGVLTGLSTSISPGPSHRTESGVGLGTSEEELLEIYGNDLRRAPNPFHSQGSMYIADDPGGDAYAIVYVTDGGQVLEIRVGHEPLVRQPDPCA